MRIVTRLQLAKAIYIPTYRQLAASTLGGAQNPGMVMKLHPNGVCVTDGPYEFLVPWGMIECAVLGREEEIINIVEKAKNVKKVS